MGEPLLRLRAAKRVRRPVALKMLLARMNRRLAERSLRVKAPPGRATGDSKHFIIDVERGCLVEEDIGLRRLEQLARECGAIEPWEELERPYSTPPLPEENEL
jgi:hypothetical protein